MVRELTENTRSLIDQLHGLPKRTFGFVRKRNAAATGLLWKVAEASEPAALPEILSFVLAKDEPIARRAAQAAFVLLAAVPTTQLPWLDGRLRERSTWSGGWWGMGPRDLKRFDRFGDSAGALLELATMHPSGFVREAAMLSLSARSGPVAIPFLLIRRNDWVEQVRSVAAEALDHCVSAGSAQHIVDALPLVFRLETCVRADHGPFIARVQDLLNQPACADAVSAGLKSDDSRVRRACFSIALESPCIPQGELLSLGLSDSDPIVRLMTARTAVRSAPDGIAELLDQMECDPYTAVRQVGLDARVALFPSEAASIWERHLLDRSISIRSQCQKALSSAAKAPEAVYRAEIGSGRTSRLDVALLGLSETGGAEDAALTSRYLSHDLPRARAAAVSASDTGRTSCGETDPRIRKRPFRRRSASIADRRRGNISGKACASSRTTSFFWRARCSHSRSRRRRSVSNSRSK